MKEYEKSTIVDFKEVDRFLYVKLDSLVQMLNTTSMYHTVSLGLAPNYMEEMGLVWVLYSWKLHLKEGDYYARTLRFRTFALFQKDIYSHRYFYVVDENGKTVGYALSVWIVIDGEKRKMVKIPQHVQNVYHDKIDPSLSPVQDEIVQEIDAKPVKKRRNPVYTHEKRFEIRFHDIDSNDHVNNTVYIGWAMESLTTDQNETYLLDFVPEDLSIVYKKEKRPGGNVLVKSMLEDRFSYHEIYDEEDNLLSIVELKWKRRS
ncbi:acyl-[acyl-carrier-protein] thioesterase [Proteiniclasticum sp. C24MP]|uniref:acyl-[acyl-carrier-protein] thioesterase n=1 Tax=Proteiniclasticum sp. C24MP TaxID=3374101 RepID=UPI00375519FE